MITVGGSIAPRFSTRLRTVSHSGVAISLIESEPNQGCTVQYRQKYRQYGAIE